MNKDKEIIDIILKYDLLDGDIISGIYDFYKQKGYISEKQRSHLLGSIKQYENAGGQSYAEHYEELKY